MMMDDVNILVSWTRLNLAFSAKKRFFVDVSKVKYKLNGGFIVKFQDHKITKSRVMLDIFPG